MALSRALHVMKNYSDCGNGKDRKRVWDAYRKRKLDSVVWGDN
jgi:hypothetical protein